MSRIFVGGTATPPPPPSAELVALRVFAAAIRYLYRRGGAITRRQVRAALDALDAATRGGS